MFSRRFITVAFTGWQRLSNYTLPLRIALSRSSALAEQHVSPNSVAAALPASLIARVRYDQGQLDEAEAMLIDRVPLIDTGTMLECVLRLIFRHGKGSFAQRESGTGSRVAGLGRKPGQRARLGTPERCSGFGAGAAVPR